MKRHARVVGLFALMTLGGASSVARAQADSLRGFPHAKHVRLFPTCDGCHAGIAAGNAARSFPARALCATCHNGSIQPRVSWAGYVSRGAGLLVFSHPAHVAKAKDATCATCHALADTSQWMNVGRAAPERCLACHAHRASAHLAVDNNCATCHRPLTAASALSEENVAALPRPPSHDDKNFLTTHGTSAKTSTVSCAICHARESCQRCHVGGAQTAAIATLAPDARVARLQRGKAAVYATPADHRTTQFALTHGTPARDGAQRCAICHARESCETCHTGEGARDVLRQIPSAREGGAPGVQLRRETPVRAPASPPPASFFSRWISRLGSVTQTRDTTFRVRVHPADFVRTHRQVAASGELQCSSCHAQRYCTDCHAGERVTRRYHPANFLATHAPQAYGRETDCTSCHSTEAFCRSCHRQAGLAAKTNARSVVFHNAQPLWLLQHGQAARQDLNACATCHQQTYCMQCHSDLGSRINPHGPGFNAARMASKNPQLCLMCHFTNPLAK